MMEKVITIIFTILVTSLFLLIRHVILNIGKPKCKPADRIASEIEARRVLLKIRKSSRGSIKFASVFFIALWGITALR